jgi:hypothetical protein
MVRIVRATILFIGSTIWILAGLAAFVAIFVCLYVTMQEVPPMN